MNGPPSSLDTFHGVTEGAGAVRTGSGRDHRKLFRSAQVNSALTTAIALVYGAGIVGFGGGWWWIGVAPIAVLVWLGWKLTGSLCDLYEAEGNYREAVGAVRGFDEAVAIRKRSEVA